MWPRKCAACETYVQDNSLDMCRRDVCGLVSCTCLLLPDICLCMQDIAVAEIGAEDHVLEDELESDEIPSKVSTTGKTKASSRPQPNVPAKRARRSR